MVASMRQRDGGFQVGMAGLAQTGGICDYTLDLAHGSPSENNARQLLQAQFYHSSPGRRCLDACINISIGWGWFNWGIFRICLYIYLHFFSIIALWVKRVLFIFVADVKQAKSFLNWSNVLSCFVVAKQSVWSCRILCDDLSRNIHYPEWKLGK